MSRRRTDNGEASIPEPVEREITGDLVASVIDTAAGAAPGQSLEERYKRSMIDLADHLRSGNGNGNGGNGHGPDGTLDKMLPRHPWLRAITKFGVVGAFTAGVAYGGVHLAIKNNEKAIETHAEKPMHDAAAEQFSKLESSVSSVSEDVSDIKDKQSDIAGGIEQLKQERVEQLKEELRLERYRNRRPRDRDE